MARNIRGASAMFQCHDPRKVKPLRIMSWLIWISSAPDSPTKATRPRRRAALISSRWAERRRSSPQPCPRHPLGQRHDGGQCGLIGRVEHDLRAHSRARRWRYGCPSTAITRAPRAVALITPPNPTGPIPVSNTVSNAQPAAPAWLRRWRPGRSRPCCHGDTTCHRAVGGAANPV